MTRLRPHEAALVRARARARRARASRPIPALPLRQPPAADRAGREFTEEVLPGGTILTTWADQPEEGGLPPLLQGDTWTPAEDLDFRPPRPDGGPLYPEARWAAGPMPDRSRD